MQTADILKLVEYNQWANGRIMRRAAHLDEQQLTAECWLSQGTLIDSLIHLADAQWFWRMVVKEGTPEIDTLTRADFDSVTDLRQFLKEEDAALVADVTALDENALNELVTTNWPRSKPRIHIRWHILSHIVNHGSIHRSEMGQYMATIGRSPGNMDFITFVARKR